MNRQEVSKQKRQFGCPCGKGYLSFAALFTHIKQKHQGKAPGEIIRPPRKRGRGRPRRIQFNDQLTQGEDKVILNVEENQSQNGIFKCLNIYNNTQRVQKIQAEKKQQENKRDGEILGGRGFTAFKAYKPELNSFSHKKQHSSHKKSSAKKVNQEASDLKYSNSLNFPTENFDRLLPTFIQQQQKISMIKLKNRIQNTNKYELKKIFEVQVQDTKQLQEKVNKFEFFKELTANQQNTCHFIEIQSTPLNAIISQFLKGTKQVLNQEKQAQNIESTNQNQEKQVKNQSVYDQISLFVLLLLNGFMQQAQIRFHELGKKYLSQLQIYINKFLSQHLPNKISQLNLQQYSLFKAFNPIKFILYFYNWLAMKKFEVEIAKKLSKTQYSNSKSEQRRKLKEEQNQERKEESYAQFAHGSIEKIRPLNSLQNIDFQ